MIVVTGGGCKEVEEANNKFKGKPGPAGIAAAALSGLVLFFMGYLPLYINSELQLLKDYYDFKKVSSSEPSDKIKHKVSTYREPESKLIGIIDPLLRGILTSSNPEVDKELGLLFKVLEHISKHEMETANNLFNAKFDQKYPGISSEFKAYLEKVRENLALSKQIEQKQNEIKKSLGNIKAAVVEFSKNLNIRLVPIQSIAKIQLYKSGILKGAPVLMGVPDEIPNQQELLKALAKAGATIDDAEIAALNIEIEKVRKTIFLNRQNEVHLKKEIEKLTQSQKAKPLPEPEGVVTELKNVIVELSTPRISSLSKILFEHLKQS